VRLRPFPVLQYPHLSQPRIRRTRGFFPKFAPTLPASSMADHQAFHIFPTTSHLSPDCMRAVNAPLLLILQPHTISASPLIRGHGRSPSSDAVVLFPPTPAILAFTLPFFSPPDLGPKHPDDHSALIRTPFTFRHYPLALRRRHGMSLPFSPPFYFFWMLPKSGGVQGQEPPGGFPTGGASFRHPPFVRA